MLRYRGVARSGNELMSIERVRSDSGHHVGISGPHGTSGDGSGTQTGNQWTNRWTSLVICIDGSRAAGHERMLLADSELPRRSSECQVERWISRSGRFEDEESLA